MFPPNANNFQRLTNLNFVLKLKDSQAPLIVDLFLKLLTISTLLYIDLKIKITDNNAAKRTVRLRKKYFFV